MLASLDGMRSAKLLFPTTLLGEHLFCVYHFSSELLLLKPEKAKPLNGALGYRTTKNKPKPKSKPQLQQRLGPCGISSLENSPPRRWI